MVEDLCIHKFSSTVYDKLYAECRIHVYSKVDSLSEQVRFEITVCLLNII